MGTLKPFSDIQVDKTANQSLKPGGSPLEMVLDLLPSNLSQVLSHLTPEILVQVEEIRIRQGRPLMVRCHQREHFVNFNGVSQDSDRAYLVTREDVNRTVQVLTGSSLYAVEEELRHGYLTIPGGHRVGLAGRVVVKDGQVETIRNIAGLNLRLAREFPGAGSAILPYLVDRHTKELRHTLIVSPPRCGKTTILRDLVRQVSSGVPELGLMGRTVGVVDERSEIAGSYKGVPQLDVGLRTDVLDACPKAQGMMMLVRAMGPEVIVADEIGRPEDFQALEEVINAGIKVLTSLHGRDLSDLEKRPSTRALLERGVFERLVFLSRRSGVATVEQILDGSTLKPV
ncbi:MAG: stage III sporulation protein AA [Firmicutes bacterium]|nr:stage III sporulation protein AA [Bacillota bacterium]